MAAGGSEPVAIAILARAPIAGCAKTRLAPVLGAAGAAALQEALIRRAAQTACAAETGPVTVWTTPDEQHPVFVDLHAQLGVRLACQGGGDLGARMLAAIALANGPTLVIGTDCPALAPDHLKLAAQVLCGGDDVVLFPAEDGGYVLIGAHQPIPALFADMPWGGTAVAEETRRRLSALRLSWQEPVTLWDVDRPADLARLRAAGMQGLLPDQG
jgi:rSAM/selenodomain-associated transferase 1